MYFDHAKLLADKFGTRARLMAFLRAYSAPLPQETAVAKWFQRGTIPSDWLPVILAYLELDEGAPVRLAPYLKGGS